MDFLAVLATWAIVSSMEKDEGGFLSENAIHFSNLQKKNIPNHYPEHKI